MRTPPVCRSRLVGFRISSDRDGSVRLTSAASVMPNASISSGLAFASGKCNRVPDATPSSAWQPRHCAASKIGYTVRVNEMPGVPGACPATLTLEMPRDPIDARTKSVTRDTAALTTVAKAMVVRRSLARRRKGCATRLASALLFILFPGLRDTLILLRRTQRNSRRRPFAPRHDARRMRFPEAGQPFLRHLRLAHVDAPQPGQLAQPREGFVADRCVREIQARQIGKRFEVRRRGVVDALHVPQAQTPQIPEVRERLQPVRRDRGAAHIQVLQLFELR